MYRDIVGAFVFSNDNKILLGKSNRATYEGQWIVPGGGIENGESKLDALKRELLEETSINSDNVELDIKEIDLKHGGESEKIIKETGERVLGVYVFYNFTVKINLPANEIKTTADDDFQDITWHDLSTLGSIDLSPPTRKTLEHLGVL